MLPFIVLAVGVAAVAGKAVYDAVSDSGSTSSSSSTSSELERERDRLRQAERKRLKKEACDEAREGMLRLLETHAEVIAGTAKSPVRYQDLRDVAAMAPRTEGATALEPLAVELGYTRGHKAEARRIARLKAEHAALQELIRSL